MTGVGPIEPNVPRPSPRGRPRSFFARRLAEMKIGDSFFTETEQLRDCVRSAARTVKVAVETHRVEENGVIGFRIWRVA